MSTVERHVSQPAGYLEEDSNDELVTLMRVGTRLSRRWKPLLGAIILGAVGGLGIAARQPNIYTASAFVKVEPYGSGSTQGNLAYTIARLNAPGLRESIRAELIESEEADPGSFSTSAIKVGELVKLSVTSSDAKKSSELVKVFIGASQNDILKDARERRERVEEVNKQLTGTSTQSQGSSVPVPDSIIRQVIPPALPTVPDNGDRNTKSAFIGALASAILAGAGLLGLDLLRGRVGSKREAERVLMGETPVLAEFQMPERVNRRTDLWSVIKVNRLAFSGLIEGLGLDNRRRQEAGKIGGNVLCIGSRLPGEGKTTVALGLAERYVKSSGAEVKVVVVDADLYKGTLCEKLGIGDGHNGLAELLEGNLDPRDAVIKTNYGFDVITAGRKGVDDPNALLKCPKLGQLMEFLGKEYDLVIVDLPPDEAVGPDGRIIRRSAAGGLVYVVGAETNGNAFELRRALAEHHDVSGVVINGVPFSQNPYYYTNGH